MKPFIISFIIIAVFNNYTMGQSVVNTQKLGDFTDCINEIGNDNQPKLNECESKCLNYEFQLKRGTFDFYDKNVCFFTGNTGQYKVSKAWYFGIVKRHIELYDTLPLDRNSQLIFFDQEESKRTGYDAAVICQSKKLITKKELLKRLSK